jgi:hypothetical protein
LSVSGVYRAIRDTFTANSTIELSLAHGVNLRERTDSFKINIGLSLTSERLREGASGLSNRRDEWSVIDRVKELPLRYLSTVLKVYLLKNSLNSRANFSIDSSIGSPLELRGKDNISASDIDDGDL